MENKPTLSERLVVNLAEIAANGTLNGETAPIAMLQTIATAVLVISEGNEQAADTVKNARRSGVT